ncbi:MAG: hypothetical protein ACLQSX_11145, partial [Smithella sp.]
QKILLFLTVRRAKDVVKYYADKNYDSFLKIKAQDCKKIENEIKEQKRVKENLNLLLKEKNFNPVEFICQLRVVQERIAQLEQDYKDRQNEILETKEQTDRMKKMKLFSLKFANQRKLSRELWKLSINDRKRIAENMFSKILIFKDDKDVFKVKFEKIEPVPIVGQLIKEGKLHSLDINGAHYFARSFF